MNYLEKGCLVIVFCFGTFFLSEGQSTFTDVYNILQANCSASGCHGGTNPQVFDVDASKSDLYNALVNITPTNPAAAAKGDKLVKPGYPERSFLLRKIAHGLSQDLELEQAEGPSMPKNLPKLDDADIELVRQWILFGAPQNSKVADEQLITDYYTNGGTTKTPVLAKPDPSEGIQLHEGPYFLAPGAEHEFFRKVALDLPDTMEVYKMEISMHKFSHHFILYKYRTSAQNVDEGVRVVSSLLDQFDVNFNASTIATWQYNRDVVLPEGTAYIWGPGTVLDMNFHIPNYSQDSITAAEAYINFYMRPKQPETVEMFAGLSPYGGANPFILNILNNAKDTTFVMEQAGLNQTWHLWQIQAHTHKLGTDYDIWIRNPDGSKGDKIYEGYYNQDYDYNQGFYDWEHPAVRTFEPMLTLDMDNGLIHEAKYFNDGPQPVSFGLTSKDEMFITYYQYTKELPNTTGINNQPADDLQFAVYPNPVSDLLKVRYVLEKKGDVKLELFNIMGEKVKVLNEGNQNPGSYQTNVDLSKIKLPHGMYIVKFTIDNLSASKRIIKID